MQAVAEGAATTTAVTVVDFDRVGPAAWNAAVERLPAATFFHLAEWRRLAVEVYGHRAHYLAALRGGELTGLLPLIEVRSRLFGHALVSTPFCVYGGAVGTDEATLLALEDAAATLAERLGVEHLELRNVTRQREGWPGKSLYVTFRRTLHPEVEQNMLAIPRKQRAMVRKGIEAGLVATVDDDDRRFFRIYAESVRDHGTPVFPRRHFTMLRELFGDRCEVQTVSTADGRPIASVMSFYFRDEVLPYYGGGLGEARERKAFDFMYWMLMKRACESGLRVFDYGRSKCGTGSFSFKKNWGFEPATLAYQYHLVRATRVPELNPLNPKYRWFIAAWQRLPVPVANLVGPWLSRSLG